MHWLIMMIIWVLNSFILFLVFASFILPPIMCAVSYILYKKLGIFFQYQFPLTIKGVSITMKPSRFIEFDAAVTYVSISIQNWKILVNVKGISGKVRFMDFILQSVAKTKEALELELNQVIQRIASAIKKKPTNSSIVMFLQNLLFILLERVEVIAEDIHAEAAYLDGEQNQVVANIKRAYVSIKIKNSVPKICIFTDRVDILQLTYDISYVRQVSVKVKLNDLPQVKLNFAEANLSMRASKIVCLVQFILNIDGLDGITSTIGQLKKIKTEMENKSIIEKKYCYYKTVGIGSFQMSILTVKVHLTPEVCVNVFNFGINLNSIKKGGYTVDVNLKQVEIWESKLQIAYISNFAIHVLISTYVEALNLLINGEISVNLKSDLVYIEAKAAQSVVPIVLLIVTNFLSSDEKFPYYSKFVKLLFYKNLGQTRRVDENKTTTVNFDFKDLILNMVGTPIVLEQIKNTLVVSTTVLGIDCNINRILSLDKNIIMLLDKPHFKCDNLIMRPFSIDMSINSLKVGLVENSGASLIQKLNPEISAVMNNLGEVFDDLKKYEKLSESPTKTNSHVKSLIKQALVRIDVLSIAYIKNDGQNISLTLSYLSNNYANLLNYKVELISLAYYNGNINYKILDINTISLHIPQSKSFAKFISIAISEINIYLYPFGIESVALSLKNEIEDFMSSPLPKSPKQTRATKISGKRIQFSLGLLSLHLKCTEISNESIADVFGKSFNLDIEYGIIHKDLDTNAGYVNEKYHNTLPGTSIKPSYTSVDIYSIKLDTESFEFFLFSSIKSFLSIRDIRTAIELIYSDAEVNDSNDIRTHCYINTDVSGGINSINLDILDTTAQKALDTASILLKNIINLSPHKKKQLPLSFDPLKVESHFDGIVDVSLLNTKLTISTTNMVKSINQFDFKLNSLKFQYKYEQIYILLKDFGISHIFDKIFTPILKFSYLETLIEMVGGKNRISVNLPLYYSHPNTIDTFTSDRATITSVFQSGIPYIIFTVRIIPHIMQLIKLLSPSLQNISEGSQKDVSKPISSSKKLVFRLFVPIIKVAVLSKQNITPDKVILDNSFLVSIENVVVQMNNIQQSKMNINIELQNFIVKLASNLGFYDAVGSQNSIMRKFNEKFTIQGSVEYFPNLIKQTVKVASYKSPDKLVEYDALDENTFVFIPTMSYNIADDVQNTQKHVIIVVTPYLFVHKSLIDSITSYLTDVNTCIESESSNSGEIDTSKFINLCKFGHSIIEDDTVTEDDSKQEPNSKAIILTVMSPKIKARNEIACYQGILSTQDQFEMKLYLNVFAKNTNKVIKPMILDIKIPSMQFYVDKTLYSQIYKNAIVEYEYIWIIDYNHIPECLANTIKFNQLHFNLATYTKEYAVIKNKPLFEISITMSNFIGDFFPMSLWAFVQILSISLFDRGKSKSEYEEEDKLKIECIESQGKTNTEKENMIKNIGMNIKTNRVLSKFTQVKEKSPKSKIRGISKKISYIAANVSVNLYSTEKYYSANRKFFALNIQNAKGIHNFFTDHGTDVRISIDDIALLSYHQDDSKSVANKVFNKYNREHSTSSSPKFADVIIKDGFENDEPGKNTQWKVYDQIEFFLCPLEISLNSEKIDNLMHFIAYEDKSKEEPTIKKKDVPKDVTLIPNFINYFRLNHLFIKLDYEESCIVIDIEPYVSCYTICYEFSTFIKEYLGKAISSQIPKIINQEVIGEKQKSEEKDTSSEDTVIKAKHRIFGYIDI